MVSTSYPPAVIAGPRNQDSLSIVASQIPHDAGLAPVPYSGEIRQEIFFLQGGSKQCVSYSTEPRHDVLDPIAMVWDGKQVKCQNSGKKNVLKVPQIQKLEFITDA